MGSLSHCQFNSFSRADRAGVSSIKRLSIPSFLWNSVWLASLPTGRYKRTHRDKLVHGQQCVCSRTRRGSARSTLGPRVGRRVQLQLGEGRRRRLHLSHSCWTRMTRWQEASFRDNPSRVNTSLCSAALAVSTKVISVVLSKHTHTRQKHQTAEELRAEDVKESTSDKASLWWLSFSVRQWEHMSWLDICVVNGQLCFTFQNCSWRYARVHLSYKCPKTKILVTIQTEARVTALHFLNTHRFTYNVLW